MSLFEISDDILEEVGETITKKADGGRIGFSAGKAVLNLVSTAHHVDS